MLHKGHESGNWRLRDLACEGAHPRVNILLIWPFVVLRIVVSMGRQAPFCGCSKERLAAFRDVLDGTVFLVG